MRNIIISRCKKCSWRSHFTEKKEINSHVGVSITFILWKILHTCEYDVIRCSHVKDSKIILQKGVLWSHRSRMHKSKGWRSVTLVCKK